VVRKGWIVVLAACGGVEPPSITQGSTCEVHMSIPLGPPAKIELLFVIDRSTAMQERLAMLARNVPELMHVIETAEGPFDLHLGVVAAAGDGRLLHDPRIDGCAPPDGLFIRRRHTIRGGLETNYSGTLADAFTCIATLGAGGDEAARPLEIVGRALDHPANAGFQREDAYLGTVILTNQDDASVGEVSSFFDAVVARKQNPLALIGSSVAPLAADRLRHWIDLFGIQGTFVPIENDDVTDALAPYFTQLRRVIGPPCLSGDLDLTDVSPAPGLQLGCTVSDVRLEEEETVLPRCELTSEGTPALDLLPCWWVRENEYCGWTPSRLELVIERNDYAPPRTTVVTRCPVHCP
jgi:hypothetical protein